MAWSPCGSTTRVEHQVPLHLRLGDRVELLLEAVAAAPAGSGTSRRSRASAGAPATAGASTLLASTIWRDQRLPHLGVGLAVGLALEVLPDGGAERVEVLEVADLAGEARRRAAGSSCRFTSCSVDPDLAGLAPPGLVGMVVGEADLGSRRSRRGGAP